LYKFSLDILRCVSIATTNLSSWRYGIKLIKASWCLKDKSKNRKLSKSQKSRPSITWRWQKKLENL